ncbi:MAG: carboxypeptidase-like regulatory domain-containing protein, partial [Fidelibacterota bacterium]
NLFPQQMGKISGHVSSKVSGEPLVGVNLILTKTVLGAATDINGDFVILNVPAGSYELKATMIGYAPAIVRNLEVISGLTIQIDLEMEQKAVQGRTVTIIAQKPLIQKDITYSSHYFNTRQIESLPVEDYLGVLAMNPGFTYDAKGFHLRGGRAGEVKFEIDGVTVQEPNYGTSYSGISVLGLNNRTLEEVSIQSGGFNAEYGNALSGIVVVDTRTGNPDHYNFAVDYESELNIDQGRRIPAKYRARNRSATYYIYGDEYYGSQKRYDYSTGYRRYRFNIGGPVPFSKNGTFNTSVQYNSAENGIVKRENLHDHFKEVIINGKLRWQILQNASLVVSFSHVNRNYDLFDVRRKFIPQTFQQRESKIDQGSLIFNQPITSKLFQNISIGFGRTYYKAAQPGKWWDITKPEEWNVLSGQNDTENPAAINIGFSYKDSTLFIIDGDNNLFREEDFKNINFKWNLSYHQSKRNEFKIGTDINVWDLYYQAILAYKGFPFTFAYGLGNKELRLPKIQPKLYAFFIQDKVEFSGFIMNGGLRFEIFDPDAFLPSDIYRPYLDPGNIGPDLTDKDYWVGPNHDIPTPNPNAPWVRAKIKYFISPRIGVSHPITETSLFHYTYGHFYQIPDWYLLYRNYNYSYDILALYGNPDLEPEKTISYEVGFKQVLGNEFVADVTAFYKDISNLVETTVVNSLNDPEFLNIAEDPEVIRLPTWYMNKNIAWGTVKGLEFSIVKRPRGPSGFSMIGSYTFMIAKGKTSDYHDGFLRQFSRGQLEPVQQYYLNWDQRHTLSLNLDYRIQDGSGVSGTYSYGSGYPYTGYQESLLPTENNRRLPATSTMDIKINKKFSLSSTNLNIYLFVMNLFDKVNIVNFDSGENRRIPVINHLLDYPDEFQGPLDDSFVFGSHREIHVGVNIDF